MNQFAAKLYRAAVECSICVQSTAEAIPGFKYEDTTSSIDKHPRRSQPGGAGSDNDDIMLQLRTFSAIGIALDRGERDHWFVGVFVGVLGLIEDAVAAVFDDGVDFLG